MVRKEVKSTLKNTNFIVLLERIRCKLDKEQGVSDELNHTINHMIYKMLDETRFGFPFITRNLNQWINELEESNKIKRG